jgi:transposase-like protein
MERQSKYPAEVRDRAVRLVFEQRPTHPSEWPTITSIVAKMGCIPETLRKWVRQAQRDSGERGGLTTNDRERLKVLERENFELRRANEILTGRRRFRPGGARPPTEVMLAFVDQHRHACPRRCIRATGDLPLERVLPFRSRSHRRGAWSREIGFVGRADRDQRGDVHVLQPVGFDRRAVAWVQSLRENAATCVSTGDARGGDRPPLHVSKSCVSPRLHAGSSSDRS